VNEERGVKVGGGEFACVQSLGMSSAFLCFSFKLLLETETERKLET